MTGRFETALKRLHDGFGPLHALHARAAALEKQLYTRGVLSPRRLTLPDFLGIGAPRAGTTWLDRNLRAHPALFLPDMKELHYFDRRYDGLLYFYTRRFRAGRARIKGEVTPAYSILPVERIQFIRAILPDVRLILILRNPVERSWSEAVYNLKRGGYARVEDMPTDAIINILTSDATTSRSAYRRNLANWQSVFPAEQLFIAFFEAISEQPRQLMVDIFEHIGVSTDIDWDTIPYRQQFHANPAAQIPGEVRALLEEQYCDEIEGLYARFGAPVAGWRC
ncbi:MAG: sulfotransferase [Anaerolineae bacterium]|nr:sulfotransferase [Anaerolineae bacterium]